MKRLLLLGNSHLAALKLGWDAIADQYADCECMFFGAPATWTNRARLVAGRITVRNPRLAQKIAQVSGGATSVQLAEFDATAVVGMFFGFAPCMNELRRVHTHAMTPLRADSQLISRACLKQVFYDVLSGSAGFQWAKKARRQSKKPILLVPTPLSSEARLEADEYIRPISREFRSNLANVLEMYNDAARTLASSAGLILIEPPPQTVAFPGFTRAEFSRGSVRLLGDAVAHRDEDYTHMNRMYGIALLREIFKATETRPSISVASAV